MKGRFRMNGIHTEKLIKLIQNSEKKTPVKVYLKGNLEKIQFEPDIKAFVQGKIGIIFGDWPQIESLLDKHQADIQDVVIENDRRHSALPLIDLKKLNARIEPGAIIRDHVKIGDHSVIMMGAVINIGAEIGERTMIDMNVVIGGRAIIGKNCHIGAGAVIAGVIEPPSATPVIIEDDVLVGANAVILEGVRVGKGAVVAAGAVVVEDVPPLTVVAGTPAKVIKSIDEKTKAKTKVLHELRKL